MVILNCATFTVESILFCPGTARGAAKEAGRKEENVASCWPNKERWTFVCSVYFIYHLIEASLLKRFKTYISYTVQTSHGIAWVKEVQTFCGLWNKKYVFDIQNKNSDLSVKESSCGQIIFLSNLDIWKMLVCIGTRIPRPILVDDLLPLTVNFNFWNRQLFWISFQWEIDNGHESNVDFSFHTNPLLALLWFLDPKVSALQKRIVRSTVAFDWSINILVMNMWHVSFIPQPIISFKSLFYSPCTSQMKPFIWNYLCTLIYKGSPFFAVLISFPSKRFLRSFSLWYKYHIMRILITVK